MTEPPHSTLTTECQPDAAGGWYDFPNYYDAIFDPDTAAEADFLEGVWIRFGGSQRKGNHHLRILEPACGSGRLVLELAKRGHRVEGFDVSPEMLDAARTKLAGQPFRARLRTGTLENPPSKGPYDLAHCLLSTFKYMLTERDAAAHLRAVASQLVGGGLYVIGIHLTDYARTRADVERWTGSTPHFHVTCETTTFPPDSRRRTEKLRNRLRVRPKAEPGKRRPPEKVIETHWTCRTYDIAQIRGLLAKVPDFACVACFDFTHDLDAPRGFDNSQEDNVLVLAKS